MKSQTLASLSSNFSNQRNAAAANASVEDLSNAIKSSAALGLANGIDAAKASLWDDVNNQGDVLSNNYKGDYVASNAIHNVGLSTSWANVPPESSIILQDVTKIDIERSIFLAQELDGDINGQANNATSSCKEGEETFIFGASYSGTQGVRVSEISGLDAKYVRGKRVSWLDGDSWNFQKNGDSHSESYLNAMSTSITANNISSDIKSFGKVASLTSTLSDIETTKYSEDTIRSINISKFINEVNVSGSALKTYIGFAVTNMNIGMVLGSCNIIGFKIDFTALVKEFSVKKIGVMKVDIVDSPVSMLVRTGQNVDFAPSEFKLIFNQMDMTNSRIDYIMSKIESAAVDISTSAAVIANRNLIVANSAVNFTYGGLISESASFSFEDKEVALDGTNVAAVNGGAFCSNYLLNICI